MNRIVGAGAWAWRTGRGPGRHPGPDVVSMNSVAATVKKAALASPATALASRVLPQPGGPDQQEAAREPGAHLREALRGGEEVLDLGKLVQRLVDAGDVREGHPLGGRVC